jgi:hypothetical protein
VAGMIMAAAAGGFSRAAAMVGVFGFCHRRLRP